MAAADETSLEHAGDGAARVLRSLGFAFAVLDADGRIETANERWHLEAGSGGAVGDRYLDSRRKGGGHDLDLVLAEGVERVLAGRADRFELEHPVEGPLGRRWHLVVATPVEGGGAVVVYVDVTAHHDVQEILDDRAHRDPLTGLPNRLAITTRLSNAINRHRRDEQDLAVVFLDLDGFKVVNDGLGHDAGDEVLAAVGRRLAGTIRADDVLGRWGGDEFVVVVDGGGEEAVPSLAARLHGSLAEPVALRDGRVVHLGVSIGATAVTSADSPEDALARADVAMFESKRSGRPLVMSAGDGREGDQ